MTDDARLPVGRIGRLLRIARLTAGVAKDAAGGAARRMVASTEDGVRVADEATHRAVAGRLAETLGGMKGLAMKVGQMLSYIDDFIPPEFRPVYRDALGKLRVKTHPAPFDRMCAVIAADLGKPPQEIFETFDPEPIAAASIGQVYRARTRDGVDVAVKVQYPGIADAIRSDLSNLDLFKKALSLLLPKVDVERSLADIEARIAEELDYGCELANQTEFARVWEGHPKVHIPRIFPDLSADHVLTSELVQGEPFATAEKATQEDRNEYGETMFRFVFRSLYLFGIFNGDPHPGNYIFHEDGRVTFLDFGCVQRFADATVRGFALVRKLAMEGDEGAARKAMIEAYSLPADLDEEEATYLGDYVLYCLRPVTVEGPFPFDRTYTGGILDLSLRGARMGFRKVFSRGIREAKAPGLIFLNRLQYGFASVLALLEAVRDWRAIMDEIDRECATAGKPMV